MLQFNDTSTHRGLVQLYEREIGANPGDISNNATKLKQFAAEANLTWDSYLAIAFKSSGTWQYDDSNHTDYPIITTNLVSGQRDYPFTTDEQGNLILDIFRVAILPSATATQYQEIDPIDEVNTRDNDIVTGNSATGVPSGYGKLANGIFLDLPSSYNATNGLKMFINREASYFVYTDTIKKPGCPGLHHRYFALKPALEDARRNNRETYNGLLREVISLEREIEDYFSRRERDKRHIITPKKINYI